LTDEKRLKEAVFYLDESIYSRVLAFAMQAAGANVRRVGPDIPYGSTDEAWLEIVGKNNWIALMRDQRIRRRRLETEALKIHGVAAFAFTGGQETAQQTAQTICPLLIKFANMNVSEPKPFLYTFGVSGSLSKVKL
jgi:PIN like domain